jgi:uncharacterized protein (TIGR00251 family)
MPQREYNFHDGKKGVALAIRVTPRSSKNEVSQVLNDGTIQVRLTTPPVGEQTNSVLVQFMSEILGVPVGNIDIVAGEKGKDKIISVLDMDAEIVNKRILESLAG